MKTLSFILVVLATMLLFVGCSGQYPLSGTVTYSDDGSPVPVGTVLFATPTEISQANINPDGTYTVGTYGKNDGLPPGNYSVGVVGVEKVEQKEVRGVMEQIHTSLIDPKYQVPENSGLNFNADGKTKTFDIQLDRAKK